MNVINRVAAAVRQGRTLGHGFRPQSPTPGALPLLNISPIRDFVDLFLFCTSLATKGLSCLSVELIAISRCTKFHIFINGTNKDIEDYDVVDLLTGFYYSARIIIIDLKLDCNMK